MTANSIIEGLKTFLATWTGFDEDRLLLVDHAGGNKKGYTIIIAPTPKVIQTYIDDTEQRSYDFVIQSAESTADELQRIANSSFFEDFEAWLKGKNDANEFPEMPAGMTPEKIEALQGTAFLQQEQSDIGYYQIQCQLVYEQA